MQIRLQERRSEKEFEIIYEKVKKLVTINKEVDDHLLSKRKKTKPTSLKIVSFNIVFMLKHYSTVKNEMKQTFYEAIDAISGSLERRFLHCDLDVVVAIGGQYRVQKYRGTPSNFRVIESFFCKHCDMFLFFVSIAASK